MNPAFADTGYYIALLAAKDVYHAVARRWSVTSPRVVVTEFVLLELGNSLARSRWRTVLLEFIRDLRREPTTEVIPVSQELLEAGLVLYDERPDKEWSLTDCTSFGLMRQRGLTEALTADRHFEQAGFTVLLRTDDT